MQLLTIKFFSGIYEKLRSDPSVGNFLILIRQLYFHRMWERMPKETRDHEKAAIIEKIRNLDGLEHRHLNLGLKQLYERSRLKAVYNTDC